MIVEVTSVQGDAFVVFGNSEMKFGAAANLLSPAADTDFILVQVLLQHRRSKSVKQIMRSCKRRLSVSP